MRWVGSRKTRYGEKEDSLNTLPSPDFCVESTKGMNRREALNWLKINK